MQLTHITGTVRKMENIYYFFWHILHLREAVKCSVAGYTKCVLCCAPLYLLPWQK